jgi:hypothetical protein
MDVMQQVAGLPLWMSGLLLIALPTAIIISGIVIVRLLFPIEAIIRNNEVAGFKFATLGVVYAVILGLAVISVWEKFADAEEAATREASAVVAMFRLSSSLDAGVRAPIHAALAQYGESAVADDWPAMERSGESTKTLRSLDDLYAIVLAMPAPDEKGAALFQSLLSELSAITESRRERLTLAQGIVPDLLWLVLFIGAFVTLGFTFFFGLRNLIVQLLMSGMLALLIFLALFVAVSIDHPFTGTVSVRPHAMELAIKDFHIGR